MDLLLQHLRAATGGSPDLLRQLEILGAAFAFAQPCMQPDKDIDDAVMAVTDDSPFTEDRKIRFGAACDAFARVPEGLEWDAARDAAYMALITFGPSAPSDG